MNFDRIDEVRRRMGYSQGYNVLPIGVVRGLSLWWHEIMEVRVEFATMNIIHSAIRESKNGAQSKASWVFENPYRAEKHEFGDWMNGVLKPTEEPWFCGGDLNEYLWDHENSGEREEIHSHPRFLHEFMSKMELIDLGFSGPMFTWRGTRNNMLVKKRLDRGMVNENW